MIRRIVILMCVWVCLSPFAMGCNEIASPLLEGTWYKGDLHCHSTHSDGDSSVAEVIASAESKGLDFFVITDHDGNMNGSPSQWYDPDYHSEAMVMLYGVEWTTGLGHANVWSSQPFDYQDLWLANLAQDAQAAIDAAHDQGALFSINHPSARLCCPWEYEDDSDIDSIEVWNAMFWLPNFNFFSTRGFWDDCLMSGRRIPGVGGSDTHQVKGFESNFLRHAEPTTWVLAEERSADAVLAAIRAGHVSVSDEPAGPRIDFQADTDGDGIHDTMMGDNVRLTQATDIAFRISVGTLDPLDDGEAVVDLSAQAMEGNDPIDTETPENLVPAFLNAGEYLALLFKNGRLHGLWKMSGQPSRIEWTERVAPEEQVFYRVELLGSPPEDVINRLLRGFTKALSNPIYFGYSE